MNHWDSAGKQGAVFATVIAVHADGHSIDVQVKSDNRPLSNVPVMGASLSGSSGRIDLAQPDLTTNLSSDTRWKTLNTRRRDAVAIIDFIEGVPVCVGFILPTISEMKFPESIGHERRIDRHASDLYSWIDKDGNSQTCHPNGSFWTLGEDAGKLDLTGRDHNKKWKIRRNLTKVLQFFASLVNGHEVARVAVKADGDAFVRLDKRVHVCVGASGDKVTIDLQDNGDLAVVTTRNTSLDSTGTVKVSSAVDVEIKAPTIHLLGNVFIAGNISTAGAGGAAGTIEMVGEMALKQGSLTIPDGDLIASGKPFLPHKHNENGTGGGVTSTLI